MNWSNVKLILAREIRDQLRDRRTLFMIAVLPLLLYPLLGMSIFQVAQFTREHPLKVLVLGDPKVADLGDGFPRLIEDGSFSAELFEVEEKAKLLELSFAPKVEEQGKQDLEQASQRQLDEARRSVQQGDYQLILYFPEDFSERLIEFRRRLGRGIADESDAETWEVPSPTIHYNTASEKSQIAFRRVSRVLDAWRAAIGQQNLRDSHVPVVATKPFLFEKSDVASSGHRDAAVWSKVLPFVLLIWALTGAFYPAIDLCAGEKERGTLETLLSSPAERSEIVWGKLITVMIFSVTTATLNLASMGVTGAFVITQLSSVAMLGGSGQLNMPPAISILWLAIALVPVAALFSALCLALAAFARSTKEGQYYLMPLLMVTMPLMVLPMAPGVELTLGNSLIPVTGVVLLLRTMLEGNYWQALPFVAPVTLVTFGCCWLAIRWAVDQFNTESVLFRESERFDLGLWMRHLVRDRGPTPTIAEALSCFIVILLIQFFMNLALPAPDPDSFFAVAQRIFVSLVVFIAMPALLMTIMLTRSPARTLLLDRPPKWLSIPVVLVLAVALHPVVQSISTLVQTLYPISDAVKAHAQILESLFQTAPSAWIPWLLIAVAPALCEEVAFRGFILSGLRHIGHKWWAIGLSAAFFGVAHGVLQQSIMATMLGVVLGYIAVQSGSLVPCILFHLVHNSLALLTSKLPEYFPAEFFARHPQLELFLHRVEVDGQTSYEYGWPLILAGALVAGYLFRWLHLLPYQKTSEEQLQEALEHQSDWDVAKAEASAEA